MPHIAFGSASRGLDYPMGAVLVSCSGMVTRLKMWLAIC